MKNIMKKPLKNPLKTSEKNLFPTLISFILKPSF